MSEPLGELNRCQIPPEDPVEKHRVIVGLLRRVLVPKVESVGDLKECVLVFREEMLLEDRSAVLKNSRQCDNGGTFGWPFRVSALEQCNRMLDRACFWIG